ncbi:uncharacterized protein EV422DRAFT_571535 [Fimicolochytrium jonesii]|uniref:uncharacterized protein n=1 Tax=Fimicolochytrium jonesii TaxID=1396493 RepID=UPI0022FE5959|nr:uncharacterized protein EV422DRAFT_571535 [Fimicolochytrium jonesii]KAI8816560.1 hypothetical protein EV422DRAFT_571535 [Fimicolochytrium jonesii]
MGALSSFSRVARPSHFRIGAAAFFIIFVLLVLKYHANYATAPASVAQTTRTAPQEYSKKIFAPVQDSTAHPSSAAVSVFPGKVHLIATATTTGEGFCRLLKSALANDWNMTALYYGADKSGKLIKVEAVYDFLKLSNLADDDVIVMVDGFDVHVHRGPESVLQSFLEFDSPIVYSAEKTCWPYIYPPWGVQQMDKCQVVPNSTLSADVYGPETDSIPPQIDNAGDPTTRPRWLNSGMLMGRVSALRILYEDMMAEVRGGTSWSGGNYLDDQALAFERHLNGTFGITLDYPASIFMNLDKSEGDITWVLNDARRPRERAALVNRISGTSPAFFHYNGQGKGLQHVFWPKLWFQQARSTYKLSETDGFTVATPDGRWVSFQEACDGQI